MLSLLSEENRQKIIKEYEKIIHEAEIASQWQGKVSRIQKSLASASGSQKIELIGMKYQSSPVTRFFK